MALGYSLHLGLNRVDPLCYDGKQGLLNVCVNDMNAMYDIAMAQGFTESICLQNHEVTIGAFRQSMEAFAEKTQPGDLFLLTYSGHGSRTEDQNGDEQDGWDENMCLYNGRFVDDYLNELFCTFREGVRILMIADCCHGGTIHKYGINETVAPLPKELRNQPEPEASVLLLSATASNQESYEGKVNGKFTERLLEVWDGGSFKGNYEEFKDAILDLLDSRQIPMLQKSGKKNDAFYKQRPFQIRSSTPTQ